MISLLRQKTKRSFKKPRISRNRIFSMEIWQSSNFSDFSSHEYYYVIVFRTITVILVSGVSLNSVPLHIFIHLDYMYIHILAYGKDYQVQIIFEAKKNWNHTEINSKENKGMKNIMKDSQIDPKAENSFLTMCRGIFFYFCK